MVAALGLPTVVLQEGGYAERSGRTSGWLLGPLDKWGDVRKTMHFNSWRILVSLGVNTARRT